MPAQSRKLLGQVRHVLRLKHYASSTERTYVYWIRKFIRFHNLRHPRSLRKEDFEAFLSHLAIDRKVAASTQNQALNAILFLYEKVLHHPMEFPIDALRAKRPKRLPTVLSQQEARKVLECMFNVYQLMANLLYGSGLRVMECVRLRVKDIDFERKQIIVRESKGARDRATILPHSVIPQLQVHLKRVFHLHRRDLAAGYGSVFLPQALASKYPRAEKLWIWQFVFPSSKLSIDPHSCSTRRHHIHPGSLRKAVKRAVALVGLPKRVTPHTFRHSFATPLTPSTLHDMLFRCMLVSPLPEVSPPQSVV
jgi:integron integrase